MTEMSDQTAFLDQLAKHFGRIVRYVAPGFALLVVLGIVVPELRESMSEYSATLVVCSMLAGLTLYSVQKCVCLRLVLWFLHRGARCRRGDDPEFLYVLFVSAIIGALCGVAGPVAGSIFGILLVACTNSFADIWFRRTDDPQLKWNDLSRQDLDKQRWMRRASGIPEVKGMQDALDEWGAMLNYLYCLSYSMIGVSLIAPHFAKTSDSSGWVLVAGLVLLCVAIYSEVDIGSREQELSFDYPDGLLRDKLAH